MRKERKGRLRDLQDPIKRGNSQAINPTTRSQWVKMKPNGAKNVRRNTSLDVMGNSLVIRLGVPVTIPEIVHIITRSVTNAEMVDIFRRTAQRKTKHEGKMCCNCRRKGHIR